jgi:single-stranded DNA-binding protein
MVKVPSTDGGLTSIYNFSVCVNHGTKNPGEVIPQWYSVRVFGQMADGIASWLRQGQAVQISGTPRVDYWVDQQGQQQFRQVIQATSVLAIDLNTMFGQRPARVPQNQGIPQSVPQAPPVNQFGGGGNRTNAVPSSNADPMAEQHAAADAAMAHDVNNPVPVHNEDAGLFGGEGALAADFGGLTDDDLPF